MEELCDWYKYFWFTFDIIISYHSLLPVLVWKKLKTLHEISSFEKINITYNSSKYKYSYFINSHYFFESCRQYALQSRYKMQISSRRPHKLRIQVMKNESLHKSRTCLSVKRNGTVSFCFCSNNIYVPAEQEAFKEFRSKNYLSNSLILFTKFDKIFPSRWNTQNIWIRLQNLTSICVEINLRS